MTFGIMLTLLSTSLLTLAFNIQLVKANPNTIYVDDDNTAGPWDGTSNHPYQNITSALEYASAGDIIYVYNGTYYESITANKTLSLVGESVATTIIDGGGIGNVIEVTADNVTVTRFTIRNGGKEWTNSGIALTNAKNCNLSGNKIADSWGGIRISEASSNNSIYGNNITNNLHGIMLYYSSNNSISGNNITTKNGFGIFLHHSAHNSIYGNNIANNLHGIELDFSSDHNSITRNNITANSGDGIGFDHSSNNILSRNNITANSEHGIRFSGNSDHNNVSGNKIANNFCGILIEHSSNNKIFHNNLVENQKHTVTQESHGNVWDDSYPSGGNYWDDYTGVDANSDGIGDTQHPIDENNRDRYSLVGPFNTFDAGIWNNLPYCIDIVSNFTVSKFQLNRIKRTISFNIVGSNYMLGFCRVTIPNVIIQDFWQDEYTVLVDRQPIEFRNWTEMENTYIYFTYQNSRHQVTIMPEFSQATILLPFIVLTVIVAAFLVLTIIAVAFRKRKIGKKSRTSS